MTQSSRIIKSNQLGIHHDLEDIVRKHMNTAFQKPVTDFNRKAFDVADKLYRQHRGNFILDSGCGVGESTFHLANNNPEAFVIGVDQSLHRIERNHDWTLPDNALLLRADLIDFWRLAAKANWQLNQHFLLYPNPWPKKKHLQRRWHGHPVFPMLKVLGGKIELRSNWLIYAEEFVQAFSILSGQNAILETWQPQQTITPFERKYQNSGQMLYRVSCTFSC